MLETETKDQPIPTLTVLGNEAIAYGLLDGGIKFAAAYPGTPSTEIMETVLAKFSDRIKADWSSNEAVAMEEAAAAAITGTDAATFCKSVGLNVAMDPLMTLAFTGVNAAMVIVVADDPGMHSSQNEQDNRIMAQFAGLPMFEPASIQEAYEFSREAVKVSREFKMPVFIRMVTRISHALGVLERKPPITYPEIVYEKNPKRYVSIPGHARANKHRKLGLVKEMEKYFEENAYYTEIIKDNPEYLLLTGGSSANYAIETVNLFNFPAHLVKFNLTYPLPEKKLFEWVNKYDKIIVVEELEPVIENMLASFLVKNNLQKEVIGKHRGITSFEGELTSELLFTAFSKEFGLEYTIPKSISQEQAADLLRIRPPVLCAGCPHRSTYVDLTKAIKRKKPLFFNDIGCYSLGVLPPHNTADTIICMGASIPMAVASSQLNPDNLAVALIGDSTFWHTGVSGLANALWKNADVLIVVMDNHTTAMTGDQPNPSVKELDIAKTCEAMGAYVEVIDPMQYKDSRAVFRKVGDMTGVRVVVSKEPCVLAHDFKVPASEAKIAVINEKCTGCTLCVNALGCPALRMSDDGKIAEIDPVLCTGCMYCNELCNFEAIDLIPKGGN